jgi:hypothetical protein
MLTILVSLILGANTMLIYGFRGNVDWSKVRTSFKRCVDLGQTEIDRIIKQVKSGQTVLVPDDFVLHDELRDLGLLIK